MRTIRLTLVLIALVANFHSESWAQDSPAATPNKTTIESFNWIAGNWHGQAMGGEFEESWNSASGGAMMGMFKFVNDGKINFYEILTIVPVDDSFVLRLKHFDSSLNGWEEKDKSVEFPLVSVSNIEAKFDGLVFSKLGPDRMNIVVQTKSGDKAQELKFECHRAQALHPQTKSHNHSEHETSKSLIGRIFEMDSVLAKQRDNLPRTQPLGVAVESYVLGLQALDLSDCPGQFSEPFQRHCQAWKNSIEFFAQHDKLRGEMHDVIEEIRKLDPATVAELDAHMAPIMQTWQEVEKAATKFGAG